MRHGSEMDDLIERLRERASDPKRRTDAPQSISLSGPGGTLTTMFGSVELAGGSGNPAGGGFSLSSLVGDLQRVVAANQAGRPIDADIAAKVDTMRASMSTDNSTALRPPATGPTLDAAEARLGYALPAPVRRVYAEVADGGFGPGGGLLPIDTAVATYLELRADPLGPRGQAWPEGLLPLRNPDPGYEAVDVATGRIIDWNPEDLTERSGDSAWRRSFSEVAPSFEAWLTAWVDSRPQNEVVQERMDAETVRQARAAREQIAAMTSQERAAMGLPDVGWEEVVWGGIGLEPDEPR